LDHQPSVAVVILNWNGKKYLERFLPFILSSTYENMEVFLADNASTDDSVDFVQTHFPTVKILINKTNEGFAGGYNWAMQHINHEISVLLNSDVEVSKGWIEPVVELFKKDTKLAAVQPKILDFNNRDQFEYAGAAGGWIDRYGYPFSKGRIFDELEKDKHQYDEVSPIFWASGAAMFVRTAIFKEMRGFDVFFFAHQEEIDLCWRIQLAGYKILSCPASVVYHIGGGTLSKDNPHKVFLNFRNNLIMLYKNLSGMERVWVIGSRFLLDAISGWKNVLSGKSSFFIAVAKAHFGFFSWVLFSQSKSIFPQKTGGKITGKFDGNIIWQHFIKRKKRFSEIILDKK
jgi:GT2 family glycosyltransferase